MRAEIHVRTRRTVALLAVLAGLAAGASRAPAAPADTASVTLSWTAVGDDSLLGRATAYELRVSSRRITASTWSAAEVYPAVPAPAAPGTRQSVRVTGLVVGTWYWFAIRTVDDADNWSGISNVVARKTGGRDRTGPSMPIIRIGGGR